MASIVGIGNPARVPGVPFIKAFIKSDATPLKGWVVARNASGLVITATSAAGLLPGGYATKNITTAPGADDAAELNIETGIYSVPMLSGHEFAATEQPKPVYFYNNVEFTKSGSSVAGLFLCLDPRGGYEGNAIVDLSPAGAALGRALALIAAQARSGAIVCDEWTNPLAASTTGLLDATATTLAAQTVLAAALKSGGKSELAARPRNVTFTGGGTTAHCPTTVDITGTDIDDAALTETVALTAGSGTGVKAFKTIVSIVYGVGSGTSGTVAIGYGVNMGLSATIKSRAGRLAVLQEVAAGSVVTNGTYVSAVTSPPHGTYAPNTAQDGANDYALTYEQDLS